MKVSDKDTIGDIHFKIRGRLGKRNEVLASASHERGACSLSELYQNKQIKTSKNSKKVESNTVQKSQLKSKKKKKNKKQKSSARCRLPTLC
jgi:hypothetical protein